MLIKYYIKKYVIYNLLFIVNWLLFYNRYVIWKLTICITLIFLIFLFLNILIYFTPSSNKKKKKTLIQYLDFIENLSLVTIMLKALLLVTLSILILLSDTLAVLLYLKAFGLINIKLQFIFFKFLAKSWIWIFIYLNVYKYFIKVFFKFKILLEKCEKFLLKIFPIITILIVLIGVNLICFLIINPTFIDYL